MIFSGVAMRLNLDANWYYTQRNNSMEPQAACMPTSRAMYYRGNGIIFNNPLDIPDDDYFMRVLRGHSAETYVRLNYPWAVGDDGELLYPPNEIHGMYNKWLDQLVCGHRTSDFHTALTLEDYIIAMESGYVVMTSGAFEGLPGHAFCVIGWDGEFFRLADPWGDWRTGYTAVQGYDVRMSVEEWVEHVKPVGAQKKWAHLPLSERT